MLISCVYIGNINENLWDDHQVFSQATTKYFALCKCKILSNAILTGGADIQ